MNTRIYEYMTAIAEEGSVTKAAERCFISQPALSQHMKNLEKSFGAPLFERKEGALVPTCHGEIFLATARRMLQVEREILMEIERCKRSVSVSYRIFTDIHMRNILIETVIPAFSARYPDVTISTISGDTETGLDFIRNHTVDIGFFPVCGAVPPGIASIPIDQNEFVLVLPPDHPCLQEFQAHGIRPESLKQETFLLNRNHSLFRSMQDQILKQYGLIPGQTLCSHSMTQLARWSEQGKGIALLPDIILRVSKVRCPAFSFDPPWRFHHVAAYRKDFSLDPAGADLIDLVSRHYQNLAAV